MMQKTKRDTFRRILVNATMLTIVLTLTTILLLAMLGYRYNGDRNTILQGGLVQFISQPSGASVRVGTADLADKTRSKITLNPGEYEAQMKLPGYRNWSKDISVASGQVLWLNSARLVPLVPKTESVLPAKSFDSVLMQEDGRDVVLLQDDAKADLTLIRANDKTITPKTVTIPSSLYQRADDSRFTLMKQSGDDTHIVVKHTFDSGVEWLMVDTGDVENSYALPRDVNNTVIQIQFDPSSSDRAYVLSENGDVRRLNVGNGESSPALTTGVADYTISSKGALLYTSTPKDGVVTTGYISEGSDSPRRLGFYTTDEKVHVAAGEYFDRMYIATSIGSDTKVRVYDSLPASDDTASLTIFPARTISLNTPNDVTLLGFKNGGRFVTMQQAKAVATYDIELNTTSNVPIQGQEKNLAAPLQWLDSFHFWSDATGSAQQYEFDGTNIERIASVAPGFPAAYSQNNDYFYSIGATNDGVELQRTLMAVE